MKNRKKIWLRLDNAAKIYPAARTRKWSAVFRISAELDEKIDPEILQKAADKAAIRFPSFAVKLCSGVFWYYLEGAAENLKVKPETPCPCACMSKKESGVCALRILYYDNRISAEYFHSLTDGTGGLIFLKSLVAEYIRLKYGHSVENTDGVLDMEEEARAGELEDSFLKNAGKYGAERKEERSYHVRGVREEDRFLNVISAEIDSELLRKKASELSVSVTEYLTAALIESIANIQYSKKGKKNLRRLKPVKILIPVNLRPFFASESLRNFAYFINPGIDPRLGEYSFEEIVQSVHYQLRSQLNAKSLAAKITKNVQSETNPLLKVMPLFIKNFAMKAVYDAVGEAYTATTLSNLGVVKLPAGMAEHVTRMDFILGAQATNDQNCALLSYNGKLRFNITRSITEPLLEREFFTNLIKKGIPVKLESNGYHR